MYYAIKQQQVFARPGLHMNVLIYVLIGNAFYFSALDAGIRLLSTLPASVAIDSRLLVFVLSGYVSLLVNLYWTGTRTKASSYFKSVCAFTDTIVTTIDYTKQPNTNNILESLHNAVNAIGQYSFAWASKNTKFGITKQAMEDIFNQRGYDGKYLLSVHKKQTIAIMRLAILQSLQEERDNENGCLHRVDMMCWQGIKNDLQEMSGAAMSLMSCVSSNKLPFAYFHL